MKVMVLPKIILKKRHHFAPTSKVLHSKKIYNRKKIVDTND